MLCSSIGWTVDHRRNSPILPYDAVLGHANVDMMQPCLIISVRSGACVR